MADSAPKSRRVFNRAKSGCWTCRTRKVKCDEQKPLCRRCQNLGLPCKGLGYLGDITSLRNTTSSLALFMLPQTPRFTPQLYGSAEICDILRLAPQIMTITEQDSISSNLTALLSNQIRTFQSYLEFLPPAAGHDDALDSTTKCVAAALRDISSASNIHQLPSIRHEIPKQYKTLSLYMSALKNLKAGLNDPVRSSSVELLCATILLRFFEVNKQPIFCLKLTIPDLLTKIKSIYGDNETGMMGHTMGVSKLIEHRGPNKFTTAFEQSLIKTQVPLITMHALLNCQVAFISQEEWIATLQACTTKHSSTMMDANDIIVEYCAYSMPNIELLSATYDLITKHYVEEGRSKHDVRTTLLERLGRHRTVLLGRAKRRKHSKTSMLFTSQEQVLPFQNSAAETRDIIVYFDQAGLLLIDRLYVALGGGNAYVYEKNLQSIAREFLAIQNSLPQTTYWQTLLNMFVPFCNSVVLTADEWLEACISRKGTLVEPDMLCRWLKLMGIQPPEAY